MTAVVSNHGGKFRALGHGQRNSLDKGIDHQPTFITQFQTPIQLDGGSVEWGDPTMHHGTIRTILSLTGND